MEHPAYPYKRMLFAEGHHYIRVLELYPSTSCHDRDLKGVLVDKCLCQSRNTYEALSYTWGSEEQIYTIQIGDYHHAIRRNLYHALLRLRSGHQESSRLLWIDAVCIDQFDLRERNRQVSLMRGIYDNARKVLVWLGEDVASQPGQLAFDLFRQLNTCLEKTEKKTRRKVLWELCRNKGVATPVLAQVETSVLLAVNALLKDDLVLTNALCEVFSRSWFSRRWIIQEIAGLLLKVRFLCGGSAIDGVILEKYAEPILERFDCQGKLKPAINILGLLNSDRDGDLMEFWSNAILPESRDFKFVWRFFHGQEVNALDSRQGHPIAADALTCMLDKLHYLDCTDARDRVGALSGLSGSLQFHVDYGASVEDNYVAFASAIVLSGGGLRLLRSAVHRRQFHSSAKILPSWIPDWRIPLPEASQLVSTDKPVRSRFRIDLDGTQLMIPIYNLRWPSDGELQYMSLLGPSHPANAWLLDGKPAVRILLLCLDFDTEDKDKSASRRYNKFTMVFGQQSSNSRTFELITELPPPFFEQTVNGHQDPRIFESEQMIKLNCRIQPGIAPKILTDYSYIYVD